MTTGERIILTRENLGLSQKRLAEITDINKSVLSRIEAGSRPLRDDEIIKIAKALNVSTDFLLGINDTKDETFKPDNNSDDLSKDELLIAAHATKDLNEEEQKQLIQFAKFLKSQRK